MVDTKGNNNPSKVFSLKRVISAFFLIFSKKNIDLVKIFARFFCAIHFFIYLCGMEKGKLVRDKQISVIKKFLSNSILPMSKTYNWVELENAIFKITNIRKYENPYNDYYDQKRYIYEFDVIADMKHVGWTWSTAYCKRNARTANRFYRGKMEESINEDLKYFALNDVDQVVVKKITWSCL